MIIYLYIKYESNTNIFSKGIGWKPFFVCTYGWDVGTDIRTDRGDTIRPPPPTENGGGIIKKFPKSSLL